MPRYQSRQIRGECGGRSRSRRRYDLCFSWCFFRSGCSLKAGGGVAILLDRRVWFTGVLNPDRPLFSNFAVSSFEKVDK